MTKLHTVAVFRRRLIPADMFYAACSEGCYLGPEQYHQAEAEAIANHHREAHNPRPAATR